MNASAQGRCYSLDGIVPVVAPGAFVHPTAVLIGDVIVGEGCFVGPHASLRGDFGRIVMEAGSNLQDGCVMHGFPHLDTVVGPGGHVGHGAVLHGCRLEAGAMVGIRSVVMDGAVVGEHAIVAAGSLVKAGVEIPARHLAVGSPATVRRPLTEEEIAWKSEGTRQYQELARRCLASLLPAAPLRVQEAGRRRMPVDDFQPLHLTRTKGKPKGKLRP